MSATYTVHALLNDGTIWEYTSDDLAAINFLILHVEMPNGWSDVLMRETTTTQRVVPATELINAAR